MHFHLKNLYFDASEVLILASKYWVTLLVAWDLESPTDLAEAIVCSIHQRSKIYSKISLHAKPRAIILLMPHDIIPVLSIIDILVVNRKEEASIITIKGHITSLAFPWDRGESPWHIPFLGLKQDQRCILVITLAVKIEGWPPISRGSEYQLELMYKPFKLSQKRFLYELTVAWFQDYLWFTQIFPYSFFGGFLNFLGDWGSLSHIRWRSLDQACLRYVWSILLHLGHLPLQLSNLIVVSLYIALDRGKNRF